METRGATPRVRGVAQHAYKLLPRRTKSVLWRGLPGALWRVVERITGPVYPPLDAAPLARIAKEPLDRLRDPDFLTNDLLPEMGLTTFAAHEPFFPAHLRQYVGRGVRSIQWPNQFGPYLAAMTGAKVQTYVEVGVETGGTFAITVEVLRRFGLKRAIGVDFGPPALLEIWNRPEVEFFAIDSHSPGFADLIRDRAPIDLAFIDGDHSEDGVRSDFEVLRPYTRMLAFHDIVQPGYPGVGRVWKSIKAERDEYDCHEFVAQYPGVPLARLGIGLAILRK